ncbi:MAG: hypothetical protein KatS3mg060_1155 [Dehalococcoidia bacterium]|nr:MAG: hypothetical protein KatS3mg060_1155 [Dehalococcoidia bacterium]
MDRERQLTQMVRQFETLLAERFAGRRVESVGTVVAVGTDTLTGLPNRVTVRFGSGAEETFPVSLGEPLHVGDQWVISRERDPVEPRYRLERRFVGEAVSRGAFLARALPTLVIHATLQRSGGPSAGGYTATHLIRYHAIRRGQYDLYAQGIPQVLVRYRLAGTSNEWTLVGPSYPQPATAQTTTLAAALSESATSMTIVANPEFPVCQPGETVRVLVGSEIIQGRLVWSGGPTATISSLTRGVEPVPGDPATGPSAHPAGAVVTLLTVDAAIAGLRPGTNYDAQIAAVDYTNVPGPWSTQMTFTTWQQTDPPPNVGAVTVEAVAGGFEIRWPKTPIPDLMGYRVRRHTSARNWAAAARLIDASGEEEIALTNWVLWPTTRGVPQDVIDNGQAHLWAHFGVVAVRDSGVESVTPTWGDDSAPPPAPDPANVTVQSIETGVLVTISATDRARLDRGWREFVVFSAQTVLGQDEREEGRTSGLSIAIQADPASGRYYQVVSADWNGNVGPRTHNATYWKRDARVLPAPASVTVQAVRDGTLVRWTPVVGQPTVPATVRGYRVARHTSSLSPNLGGTMIAEVQGTEVVFPRSVGSGDWYGVAVVSHAGGFGNATWAQENEQAQQATFSAWQLRSRVDAIEIEVDTTAEQARQTPAFREYRVAILPQGWSSPWYIATFSDSRHVLTLPGWPPRQPIAVQLLPRLWNGRSAAPQTPFENYAKSAYVLPRPGMPPNGNFEQTRVLASDLPAYWNIATIGTQDSWRAFWAQTGGVDGPRCAAWQPPPGWPSGEIGMLVLSDAPFVFSRSRMLTVTFAYASSLSFPTSPNLGTLSRIVLEFYSDTYGLNYLSTGYLVIPALNIMDVAAYTWKEISATAVTSSFPSNAQSVAVGLEVRTTDLIPDGFLFYCDSFRVTN